MIEEFVKNTFQDNQSVVIAVVVAIVCFIISFIFNNRNDIKEFLDGCYKKRRLQEINQQKIEETASTTASHEETLRELSNMFKKFTESQELYREQSRELRDNMRKDNLEALNQSNQALQEISTINKSIENIIQRLDNIATEQKDAREKSKQQELNKLRDRLLQGWRYYTSDKNPHKGAWTRMEAESYWALFGDYEDLGGDGYMHTVVQPEMNKLDVTDM